MHHARRRLGKDGHLRVQVVDVEATIGVCDHELGEAAGSVHSLSNQVQAVGRSGPTALDAATTGGGVVEGDLLPHPYVGDARAGGDHLADNLVAGYQRVGWPELAVV